MACTWAQRESEPHGHTSEPLSGASIPGGLLGEARWRGGEGEKLLRASVTPAVMEGTLVSAAPVPSGCPQKTAHSS